MTDLICFTKELPLVDMDKLSGNNLNIPMQEIDQSSFRSVGALVH